MATIQTDESKPRKPLRLWPGVVLAIALAVTRFILPVLSQDYMQYGVMGGVLGGLLIVLWWLLFSRAPWQERLGALALMVAAIAATRPLLDKSIRTGAMYNKRLIENLLSLATWDSVRTREMGRGNPLWLPSWWARMFRYCQSIFIARDHRNNAPSSKNSLLEMGNHRGLPLPVGESLRSANPRPTIPPPGVPGPPARVRGAR